MGRRRRRGPRAKQPKLGAPMIWTADDCAVACRHRGPESVIRIDDADRVRPPGGVARPASGLADAPRSCTASRGAIAPSRFGAPPPIFRMTRRPCAGSPPWRRRRPSRSGRTDAGRPRRRSGAARVLASSGAGAARSGVGAGGGPRRVAADRRAADGEDALHGPARDLAGPPAVAGQRPATRRPTETHGDETAPPRPPLASAPQPQPRARSDWVSFQILVMCRIFGPSNSIA